MLYQDLQFPVLKDRPYFYTNFVSTIDGKVQVSIAAPYAYWPIGSKLDYQTLIELRVYADVLIHGKNTASWFKHTDNLANVEFKNIRKKLGKENDLIYLVISNHPDKKLLENMESKEPQNVYLVTSEKTVLPGSNINILRFGQDKVDLQELSTYLFKKGYRSVLVEGGPNLLGSFFANNLIDEVFLTIAPKIFGNEKHNTLTMVEGYLFPPNEVKNLKLISCKQVKDEVYLRYKVI